MVARRHPPHRIVGLLITYDVIAPSDGTALADQGDLVRGLASRLALLGRGTHRGIAANTTRSALSDIVRTCLATCEKRGESDCPRLHSLR